MIDTELRHLHPRIRSPALVLIPEPLRSAPTRPAVEEPIGQLVVVGEDGSLDELRTTLRGAALKLDNISCLGSNVAVADLGIERLHDSNDFLPAERVYVLLNVVVLPTSIDSKVVSIGLFIEKVNESGKLVFVIHNVEGWLVGE